MTVYILYITMFNFVLCQVPPPNPTERAKCFTKAYVSFADYTNLMAEIRNIYSNQFLNSGPYILIEDQVFEIEPSMNLYDGSIALNKYHRINMNKSLGDLISINFIQADGIFC